MAETPHQAVVRVLLEIERACIGTDAALVERRWPDVDASLVLQARLTDELAGLFAVAPETSPANDPKVERRVRGILTYRDDQLRRLRAYHANVGERLESIGRFRALSRSLGDGSRARLLDQKY